MPSPFPGMDPYLEGQLWPGFHLQMIAALQAALVPQLRPRYVAVAEERVYVEHLAPEEDSRSFRPDLTVSRAASAPGPGLPGALAVLAPVQVPLPEKVVERFLEIRLHDTREVVTVLEVLSPSNKRAGSDGRKEYVAKRDAVLQSPVHLVELDLLRAGERVPMARRLPPADYYVLVSRSERRPMAEVWPFTLRHRLPEIPIPLAEGDPEARVDLQEVFTHVYDSYGYDYALDYGLPLVPAVSREDDAAWVGDVLKGMEPSPPGTA